MSETQQNSGGESSNALLEKADLFAKLSEYLKSKAAILEEHEKKFAADNGMTVDELRRNLKEVDHHTSQQQRKAPKRSYPNSLLETATHPPPPRRIYTTMGGGQPAPPLPPIPIQGGASSVGGPITPRSNITNDGIGINYMTGAATDPPNPASLIQVSPYTVPPPNPPPQNFPPSNFGPPPPHSDLDFGPAMGGGIHQQLAQNSGGSATGHGQQLVGSNMFPPLAPSHAAYHAYQQQFRMLFPPPPPFGVYGGSMFDNGATLSLHGGTAYMMPPPQLMDVSQQQQRAQGPATIGDMRLCPSSSVQSTSGGGGVGPIADGSSDGASSNDGGFKCTQV